MESKVTHEVTPTTVTRLVAWQAVDSFELYDGDDQLVQSWQDYDHKRVDWVAFPAT